MADAHPVRLVLVWHFHQPEYADQVTGVPFLPWTRLHALKDYADMAERLMRHPRMRATFNVVPSLFDRLREYASGRIPEDPFLAAARKPAATLSAEERRFVVAQFFSFNRDTLARGLHRVHELAALRGDYGLEDLPQNVVERFDDAAIRDLQVLFHLAWSGPLLSADPRVRALREKGRRFSEEDKAQLLAAQAEFLAGILERWRRLAATGRVEFSVSPYYHPILPLLCDLEAAHEALPALRLPLRPFRQPGDADLHLREATRAFTETFGASPRGGWPSEGAISEAALARMAAAGWRWVASDEEVLFASLGAPLPSDRGAAEVRRGTLLYRPWRHGEGPVLLFRDHDLSDRIGFVYSGWNPLAAAEDFRRRLLHLGRVLPAAEGPYTVPVILDGENAWEYYPDHGEPFLDALYAALSQDPGIRTLTASEAITEREPLPLASVRAGSWIGHNLATWIGHPEKNDAWDRLAEAREALGRALGPPDLAHPAWRALFAAEGSDWFWWFGDDHPTPHAAEFDAGFRRHLRTAWSAAGLTPPAGLSDPIRRRAVLPFVAPRGPIAPVLDGRVTDYFEWLPAGRATATYGAMQPSSRLVRHLHYGTDGTSLYLRLDPREPPATQALGGRVLVLKVPGAPERTIRAALPAAGSSEEGPLRLAVDRVVEAALPLGFLGSAGGEIRFQVELEGGDGSTQRIPGEGSLVLPAGEDDEARFDWTV